MDTKEAYKIASISEKEIGSVERYLGFQHTSINILGDLSPKAYENLTKSGWYLPSSIEDVKQAIEDFVNVYAVMYKETKYRISNGQTRSFNNLVRGTSNKRASELSNYAPQFLSTSTKEEIAKTFCEYGDAALLRIDIREDVPYLNAEDYRGENSRSESEIILAPFSRINRNELISNWNGFNYYNVSIGKTVLKSIPDESLSVMLEEVVNGFLQNITDMKEYVRLADMPEILNMRLSRTTDLEDRKYILEEKQRTYDKIENLSQKTREFREKLQDVLMGLCRQKEKEIDEAREVIDKDREERAEALRKKQEQERLEREKIENEERRKNLISETTKKLTDEPEASEKLLSGITNIYNGLLRNEQIYGNVARTLGIDYTKAVSTTIIPKTIEEIGKNKAYIDKKVQETQVSEENTLEEITETSSSIKPFLDGVAYANEIMKDCPDVVSMHTQQSERDIKRNLYFKVQGMIQFAKLQKLLQTRTNIEAEKIGFFGKLMGKEELKQLRLQNLTLQIKELNLESPQEQKEYHIRDILADMYACGVTECGGKLPQEMQNLYLSIKSIFKDANHTEFSDEYIRQCAMHKINESKKETHGNLLATQRKGFFGKTRMETERLKAENFRLQEKIRDKRAGGSWNYTDTNQGQDAITIFENKLMGVKSATLDLMRARDDLQDTLELW